jgi:competence protein ComEC
MNTQKNSTLFFGIIIAFGLGVLWRSYIDLGSPLAVFLGALSLILIVYFLGALRIAPGRDSAGALLFITLLMTSFFFGVARYEFKDSREIDRRLESAVGERAQVEGIVIREPVLKDNYRQIVIEPKSADGSEVAGKESRILLYSRFYPEVAYGDVLLISGLLEKPSKFQTDRGDVFDYAAYLSKDNVYYTMFYPSLEIVGSGEGNWLVEKLFAVKNRFLSRIQQMVPEPHAALMGGILLGAEESLGEGLIEDFRETGLIHIVVLSGFNVTIVATAIAAVLGLFLSPALASLFAILGIIFFAIMVGLSATVVRASLMAVLAILVRRTGRIYDVGRGLMLAGALMVLHNPKILALDASFQLSFAATLGLVYLVPVIEPYFQKITEKLGLREIIMATVSAQIFVLPLILYKIGLFSVVSLPVNILVLPVIPAAMFFGFLAGVLAFVAVPLGLPFAYISYWILEYVLTIVEWSSSIRFVSFEIGVFSVWVVIGIYGLYAWTLVWAYRRFDLEALKYEAEKHITEAAKIAAEIKIVE